MIVNESESRFDSVVYALRGSKDLLQVVALVGEKRMQSGLRAK
jgi:hypothetical protein